MLGTWYSSDREFLQIIYFQTIFFGLKLASLKRYYLVDVLSKIFMQSDLKMNKRKIINNTYPWIEEQKKGKLSPIMKRYIYNNIVFF